MHEHNRKRTSPQARQRRAFTLIELLVVIAIIAILAAILFPVFTRARENARRASCQSNLKQITLGILMYVQDYDEHYPMYRVPASSTDYAARPFGWADALQPYTKSTQILQCPSDSSGPDSTPSSSGYSDYAYNLWVGGWDSSKNTGLSLATLTEPSLTVLVSDHTTGSAAAYLVGAEPYSSAGRLSAPVDTGIAELPPGAVRHLDGVNFSFADGHVKWFKGNTTTGKISGAYGAGTPGSVSGNSATFNPTP